MARIKGTQVLDGFYPDETRLKWADGKHPNLDIQESVERFLAWATSHEYVNHSRAWQNFIIRESDAGRLGPMLKKAEPKKDRGQMLIEIAKSVGFRGPSLGETYVQYEAAINDHKASQASNVVKMVRGAMK